MKSLLLWVLLGSLNCANAEDIDYFKQFPSKKTLQTCKELDFTSYFRAQDFKKQLLRDNPERTKPNYGGKFILLKHELMMETLWLIADCETGKFYKEFLRGLAQFKSDSLLILLSKPKSSDLPEYQLWKDGDWARVDIKEEGKQIIDAKIETPESYEPLFKKYSVVVQPACQALDFDSYFRAQTSKHNVMKLNPDLSQPNFAGKYILLRNDVLFERMWLIADCSTGKFLPEIIKNNLEFRADSQLILVRPSAEIIRLSLWRDERFVDLINPNRPGQQSVENKLYDQEAKDLMVAAGGSGKESKLTFEELKCIGQNCTILKYPEKTPRTLTAEQAKLAEAILKRWGSEKQDGASMVAAIAEGNCTKQRNNPVCEIKVSR